MRTDGTATSPAAPVASSSSSLRRHRGTLVPDGERCQAISRAGSRCPHRHADGTLCRRHLHYGAITPDGGWTQPDNLPIFALQRVAGIR